VDQGTAEMNHGAAGMNQGVAGRNQGVAGRNHAGGEANEGIAATGKAGAGKDNELMPSVSEVREPGYTTIREHALHAGKPVIDDAGLRAVAMAKGASRPGPITPGKSRTPSMRINRSLQIGLVVAPDFASVNSLAGDRPGSSIGLTVDYQFVNKLYLSTGILFSRKNYTATSEDYHVPYDYYIRNNIHNVDFVKGTFNLIEIPLNVRYDFSVTGNTAFFASGGLSSYVLTGENCNYYFDLFGREAWRGFNYKGGGVHLFSAVNLAIGVETGLSNDLSLLISPYVKIPTGGLGFGRIDLNSMGINFGIKYTPVLRRSRH
jgi:outer membrane protein with beta-barrel domain